MERITLKIGGIVAPVVRPRWRTLAKNADGVLTANVNLATGKASVEFDPGKVSKSFHPRPRCA